MNEMEIAADDEPIKTESQSAFERALFLTQPFRERLRDYLGVKNFCRMLCCSWTTYGSFRRKSVLLKQLQLSDLFWKEYVCDRSVSERELAEFLQSKYNALGYNGCRFSLIHPDHHAPAVRSSVAISIEAWMDVCIKFYDAPWYACDRSETKRGSMVPLERDSEENKRAVKESIDWIVEQLSHNNVIKQGETRFLCQEMHRFVFWYRVAQHAGFEPHMEYLKTTMETEPCALFKSFFRALGYTNFTG